MYSINEYIIIVPSASLLKVFKFTRIKNSKHVKYVSPVKMCEPMFHLAISNMAQRHVAFYERHVALHVRHVSLHVRHVALQVRHVALLIFRQLSASLNYCYIIFNPPRPLSQ